MKGCIQSVVVFCCLMLVFLSATVFLGIGTAVAEYCAEGSYKNSCKSADTSCEGGTLSSKCKKIDGTWKTTSLESYSACTQDIANCDGVLKCLCGTDCPSGSYSRSCFCCTTKEIVNSRTDAIEIQLSCKCKNKKGKYISTTLSNTGSCTGEISNNNGSLTCEKN
jgi:hypothetical protein